MTTIVTVTSQKGGVAKTTTATSLAHALARQGKAVLLADFDPQGHVSISLGMDPAPGIFDFFVREMNLAFTTTRLTGLALLPGNSRTRTAESVLRAESSREAAAARFRTLDAFDWIVIDTPPSGFFQELAVSLADVLVIPVRCEVLGLDGVAGTLQVAKQIGHAERVVILPTVFDCRLREHGINLDLLKRNYPSCMADPVPARVGVAEASALGQTVWEYEDSRRGLADVRRAYSAAIAMVMGGGA